MVRDGNNLGQVADVDFDNGWTVDATGLYFNVNKDVRLLWLRSYNRNVGKGNESWPATRRAIERECVNSPSDTDAGLL